MTRFVGWAAALLAAAPLLATAAERETYAGILPCADCPALRVDLTLARDARGAPAAYEERLTYVDRRGSDKAFTTKGRWTIADGLIRLDDGKGGKELLKRDGDRALRMVDADGRDIPSPIAQVLWRTSAKPQARLVRESDAAHTIVLAPGQEIAVTLGSNRSTGYRWWLSDAGEPVVAMTAAPVYKPSAAAKPGAPGEERWRLFAFRPGTQKVTFEYRRGWERDPVPAKSFSFNVDVR